MKEYRVNEHLIWNISKDCRKCNLQGHYQNDCNVLYLESKIIDEKQDLEYEDMNQIEHKPVVVRENRWELKINWNINRRRNIMEQQEGKDGKQLVIRIWHLKSCDNNECIWCFGNTGLRKERNTNI